MKSTAWAGDWPVTQPWGCTPLLVEPWWQSAQCHWHCGVDLGLPMQTPLYAIRDGYVTGIGSGYLGILVEGDQTDWYVHGVYSSMRFGIAISRGQSIGYSSNVVPSGGFLTGPHLHFEVQESGGHLNNPATSLDPIPVLAATFGAGGSVAAQEELMRFVIDPSGSVYAIGASVRHIGPLEWADWKAKGFVAEAVTAAAIAEIFGNLPLVKAPAATVDLSALSGQITAVKIDTTSILAKVNQDLK